MGQEQSGADGEAVADDDEGDLRLTLKRLEAGLRTVQDCVAKEAEVTRQTLKEAIDRC